MRDVELNREAIGYLEMYVLELVKLLPSGRVHVTDVIPSGANQFVKFEPVSSELDYDRHSGWFSLKSVD